MRRLNKYTASVLSSTMLATLAVAPAYAQDSDEAANEDPNVIIVEATLRATDVQDIPLAVTAVSPQQLEQQGIKDISTLAAVSPSFNINSSQTQSQGTSIRIRGIGTTGNNIGLESAVGVFIDGVYQSRPGVALGDLLDLQQIEVLRGPQGTLFGRNTTAGALNIKTAKPSLNGFSGFANATYGNFDALNLQAGVNVPVGETFAVRMSGAYRKQDGFLTSALNANDESHNKNRWLVRGQAYWEPTSDISLRIIADYQKTNEKCCAAVTLSLPLTNLNANGLGSLYPNANGGITNQQTATPFFNQSHVNRRQFHSSEYENDIEQWGVSAELNWDFGGAKLTYIGAYRDFLGSSRQDEFNPARVYSVSGITFPPGTGPTFDDIKTMTHELRLQGTAFNDKLDWLVGAFYADESIKEEFSLGLGADFSSVVSAANFGNASVLSTISAAGNFFANGGTNPATFVPISSNGAFSRNLFTQDAKSFSVFTHNIFNVTDEFSITLGARYVDDKKDGAFDQLASSNNACLAGLALANAYATNPTAANAAVAFGGPALQGLLGNAAARDGGVFLNCFPFAAPALGVSFLPAEFSRTFKDDEFIYTVQAGYKPNEDLLLYGSFTHGYKAGGFNLDVTAAAGGRDPRFASEEVDTYEVGIKSTLLDGRMRANLAIFYNEVADFQVLEFTGTQFQTFNVDNVTSKGFELEINSRWTDYISNNFSITYADAEYGKNCDNGGTITAALGLCGEDLTNAPKWAGIFGMTYDGPLDSSGWGLLVNANVQYESNRRTRTKPTSGPFDEQDANMKINARIGFTEPSDRFTFEVFGNNLTNEITRNITFNTPLMGASTSAFIQDPRTYGMTVRAKF
jgi:iron complex outermembrane recepter protein